MTTASDGKRLPRFASDNARATAASSLALAITLVVSFVGGLVLAFTTNADAGDFSGLRTYTLTYFGFWIGYSLIYMAMTWHVFHRADAATLERWLRESTTQRRARRVRERLLLGSGPFAAVSFAAVAVLAVLLVAVATELRRDPLVVGLAIGTVAVSWLLLVTAYAVHYAREEVHAHQLEFAGGEPVLADYVYLSVQVSTTFSASDVTVVGTAMRRTVSGHAVVAFAFSTVIIALLVSVVVSGVG